MNNLTWTAHPLRKYPLKAIAVIIIIIFTIIFVAEFFHDIFLAVISGILLLGATIKFYSPSTYILDDDIVEVKFLGINKKYKWSNFKSVFLCKGGVLLSPFSNQHWLDTFRGVYLLCIDNHREVFDFAKRKIKSEKSKD